MLDDIPACAITLLGVLVAAALTYRLARSGFSRDKVWERRVEAYSKILLALETAETKIRPALEGFEPDPHQAWNDEDFRAFLETIAEDIGIARQCFASSALVLSPNFARMFKHFQAELETIGCENLDPPEQYQRLEKALGRIRSQLERQAKRDLGI